ncbi:hypothetical protein [Verrucosispora sp. SN26_14.1]|uniref:hypothetical protein n=1 Tax=Verrucosispora sp. SN26_14.1 TaxID=2527879 RepID=UPI001F3C8083|nr:hypothetical protein [Verrucosispora sp. SN26_14.1]
MLPVLAGVVVAGADAAGLPEADGVREGDGVVAGTLGDVLADGAAVVGPALTGAPRADDASEVGASPGVTLGVGVGVACCPRPHQGCRPLAPAAPMPTPSTTTATAAAVSPTRARLRFDPIEPNSSRYV